MTGIIEFSSDTLNIEVSGINNNIPIDLVEVISTGQDIYVSVQTDQNVLAVNGRQGFITLNKSDVGLQNVENISITGVSGVLNQKINNLSGDADNKFYLKSNPSGFVTGVTNHAASHAAAGSDPVTPAAIGAAATNHSHQPSAIYCDAVDVSDTTLSGGEPNGIYFRDGSDNGKAIYKSAQGYALWWDDGEEEWVLGNVPQAAKYYIGTGDTEYPWQATAWALGPQGSGDTPVVDQALLSNVQRNAVQDVVSTRTPKTGNASSTQVVLGNDTRLTNSRTPTAHAASHAAAGSDPIAPSDIGAQSVFISEQLTLTTTAQVTLSAARAKVLTIVQYAGANVDVVMPQSGFLDGDVFVFKWGTGSDSVVVRGVSAGSPITTISAGQQKRVQRVSPGGWVEVPVDTHTHPAASISDSTTAGRALLTGADAAAQRTTLGLGTAATSASTDFYSSNNPSGYITGVDLSAYVTKSGGQFIDRPTVNGTGILLSGEAASLPTTIVYTTGNQTISGIKTFNNGLSTSHISGIFGSTLNIIAGSGVGPSNINASDLILMGGSLSGISPNILKTGASITIGGAKALATSNITIRPSIDQNANVGNIVLEAGLSPTYNGKINMFGDINVNGTSDPGIALSSKNINIYRRGDLFGSPSQRLAISIDNNNVDFQNGMGLRVSGIQVTPSAYVTGSVVRPSETGVFYPRSNPSGFITSQNVVYTFGDQIISGTKYFNNSVYIHDLYVTGTEFIATVQNNFIESPYILLNLTGGAIDGGIFFVTGSGLTGVNDYGPIIGFDHTNKFKFGTARRSDDLSTLNDIAAVQDIQNYSGFVNGKYSTIINLESTGSNLNTKIDNLSGYSNNTFATAINLESTGSSLDTKINNYSGFVNSNFYGINNPSGYITNQNVVFTTGNQTISGVKTFATGIDIFNGTSPQSLRIFNTTGTNSGEFGQIGWSGNTFIIAPQSAQSGINRNLEIHAAGFGRRIIVTNNGHVGIGTSAGDQTSHGIWVNPAAGQTSISHGGQVLVNASSVMFNSNTRIFNNNAFTFGTSQNNTTPMIRGVNVGSGFTSIQARLADNSNFVNFEANKLIANSGADIYFSGTAGTGVSGSHVGVLVSGLWNNTGQIYTGVRYNITLGSGIVPSTANSLLNLAVNNTGVFNVNSKGQVLIQQLAGAIVYDNIFEIRRGSTNYFTIRDDGSVGFNLQGQACSFQGGSINAAIRNGAIVTANGGFLGFSKSADAINYPEEHTVRLYRGGDFVLDLRNASYPTSGHQFRVFNITGTNTGEFGVFGWQRTGASGTPNAFVIGAQATQSGTLRNVVITGANISLASSGVIIPNPTVPTSTGSAGSRGQISWDNDFIYVCVSGNSWKRAALTTW